MKCPFAVAYNGPGICEGWGLVFCPPTTNADKNYFVEVKN